MNFFTIAVLYLFVGCIVSGIGYSPLEWKYRPVSGVRCLLFWPLALAFVVLLSVAVAVSLLSHPSEVPEFFRRVAHDREEAEADGGDAKTEKEGKAS